MWWTSHFQSFVFFIYHLPPLTKDGHTHTHTHTTHTTSVTIIPSSTARDFFTSNESVCFPYVWWGKYPADPQWEDTQVTNGDGMGHLHDGIVDQIFSDDRSNKETNDIYLVRDENNFHFGGYWGYFNLDTMIIYSWNVFGKPTKNTKHISCKFFFRTPREREFGSTLASPWSWTLWAHFLRVFPTKTNGCPLKNSGWNITYTPEV